MLIFLSLLRFKLQLNLRLNCGLICSLNCGLNCSLNKTYVFLCKVIAFIRIMQNFFAMFVLVVVYIVWKRQSTIMESEMRLRLRSTPVTLTMTC